MYAHTRMLGVEVSETHPNQLTFTDGTYSSITVMVTSPEQYERIIAAATRGLALLEQQAAREEVAA